MKLPTEQHAEHSEIETEKQSGRRSACHDESLQYIIHSKYLEAASKQDKGVIRKPCKHYTEPAVAKINRNVCLDIRFRGQKDKEEQ